MWSLILPTHKRPALAEPPFQLNSKIGQDPLFHGPRTAKETRTNGPQNTEI